MEDFITKHNTLIVIVGLFATLLGWLIGYINNMKGKILLTVSFVGALFLGVTLYFSWDNRPLFWFCISVISNLVIWYIYHYFYISKKIKKGILKPKYQDVHFKRFEGIKTLKYGFIEYSPFFWKEMEQHKGIGIEVLQKVFENKITLERYRYGYGEDASNWDNIFKDLEDKKFDIIVTPLFETRTRLYAHNVIYCSPLFYSNIGLYISDDSLTGLPATKLTFPEALTFLKKYINERKWKPEILKGEIAEAIAKKYELISKLQMPDFSKNKTAKDSDFCTILKNMSSHSNEFGDFTFMEVFKAESIIKNDSKIKVTNILKSNELLYPVSFVLRKEDTVLRNLINIRLLELRDSGELKKAILKVANIVNIDNNSFDEIFIQKYDFENLTVQ